MASSDLVPHLTLALTEHRRWCRTNGIGFPGVLDFLLAALADSNGQARPNLDPSLAAHENRPQALDYQGAARRLGVSARTARRMVADGRLAAVRVGTRVVIPASAVDDYLRVKHEVDQQVAP